VDRKPDDQAEVPNELGAPPKLDEDGFPVFPLARRWASSPVVLLIL
jgi:hypothetical protein